MSGGLNVLTQHHRAEPYMRDELSSLRRGRDAIEAYLAFGVLIRT
ncbi:hypothetical protein [Paragemmobacter aquarius]|nr:hypothetical protein [Gemmobacter aquarius]